jgi:hypothetical protein
MSQSWKKIQATLLAWARAEKKAVEEARASNASTMDKGRDLPSESSTTTVVDARQRNERNARMGTLETGWLRVVTLSGSADFTGKLDICTLRLRGSHFV